ncbi:cytochrome b/b6 domain-containing protein [Oceanibacterium hippocampi]|nr:cytochrome b/b6 domain-containing protein [Oceanibacterium hippocampi]
MTRTTVPVWDPLVRLFHWSLVAAFAIAWLTADELDRIHEWSGYVAGGLVAFRLLWGLIGPRHARFSQFVRSPAAVGQYLRDILRGRERRFVGHNPAGAAMILALLAITAMTATTGWMTTLDVYWGIKWVEDVHEIMANLMIVMVAIHVTGVALTSLRHRENLVRAMIVGRKRAPSGTDID